MASAVLGTAIHEAVGRNVELDLLDLGQVMSLLHATENH